MIDIIQIHYYERNYVFWFKFLWFVSGGSGPLDIGNGLTDWKTADWNKTWIDILQWRINNFVQSLCKNSICEYKW